MRIRAGTDRGDLDCPDEIRSTISCCLKATRSEHPTLFSMDNRMRRVTVSERLRCSPQLAILAVVLSFTHQAATQKVESIPVPGTKAFPESITSTSDGALFVGRLGDGGIVRVKPRTAESTVFIQPGASGSRSILGVFADEASSTLWACSNDLSALGGSAAGSDTWSALKSFDLNTGDANTVSRCPALTRSATTSRWTGRDPYTSPTAQIPPSSNSPPAPQRSRYSHRIPHFLRLKVVPGSTGSPLAAMAIFT